MDLEKRTEYIRTRLSEKGIDQETQDYVLKYVDMNQQLFGNILDIDKVVDRIVNNLHHSISTYDLKSKPLQGLRELFSLRGCWSSSDHRIEINPVHKLLSRILKKVKEQYDSTIMHEIDHCATTEYVDKSRYFNMSKEKLEEIFREDSKTLSQLQGKKAISGIAAIFLNPTDRKKGLRSQNLRALNEGITAYKQEMYNGFLGNKSKTPYKKEKLVAKFIGEVIGKDELIFMHFNNDYNAMRIAFQEKTGQDLDKLVSKITPRFHVMSKIFSLYARHHEKNLERFMQTIRTTGVQSEHEKCFIPKCEIDHAAAIAKVMEESQSPTYTRIAETGKAIDG